jgi:ERCC4-type nuclease
MWATVIADARERDGANPHLEAAVAENNRRCSKRPPSAGGNPIDYLIQTITVGDYVVMVSPSQNSPVRVPVLIIERKTWKDLASSIKDTRAKTQHARMMRFQSSTHCRFLYMIEGIWNHNDNTKVPGSQGMYFLQLHAKLRHNLLRGMPYIQTRDEVHSAKILVDLARDALKLACESSIVLPGLHSAESLEKQAREELLSWRTRYASLGVSVTQMLTQSSTEAVPVAVAPVAVAPATPVGEANADPTPTLTAAPDNLESQLETVGPLLTLPKMLTERVPLADADVLERMWMSFPKVGEKMASALRTQVRLRQLLMAGPDETAAWIQRIAGVTLPSGARLGANKAAVIVGLLQDKGDVVRTANLREVYRGILEAIPGISGASAQLILDHYTVRQICIGDVGETQLAEIKRVGAGNRKLGPAAAQKICHYLRSVA